MNIRHAYFIIIVLCANNAHGLSIAERKMLGRNAPPPIASTHQRYEEMQKQSSREQAEQALIEKNAAPPLTKEDIAKIIDEKLDKTPKTDTAEEGEETASDPTETIENNPNFGKIGGLGTVGGIGASGGLIAPSDGTNTKAPQL